MDGIFGKLKEFFRKDESDDDCIQFVEGEYKNICKITSNRKKEEESNENIQVENIEAAKPLIRENPKIGEPIPIKKGRPPKNIREEYYRVLKLNNSKNTLKSYKGALKFWDKFAERKGKTIYYLTASDLEEALEKYSNSTRVQRMSSLRKLAKIYLRSGYTNLMNECNMVIIRSKKENTIVKYLNEKKSKDLRDKIIEDIENEKREGLWFGLFLFCGLRISEVFTIKIESDTYIKVLGKGNKERLVPCPSTIIKGLKNIKENGRGGWRKNGKIIDTSLRRSGLLEEFHCHQLRHTFATGLYRKGVPINTLKDVLGHTTIMTTQIYAKSKVDESILNHLDIE